MHVTMYMSIRSKWKSLSLVLLAFLILGASIPSIQSLSANLRISSTGTISYIPGIIGSNIWTADFETGDLSQFSGVDVDSGNLLEATSTVKYNGNYGMHVQKATTSTVSKGTYELTAPMSAFHFSFAYKSGTFSTSGWVRLFELRATTGTKLVWMDYWAEIYYIDGKTGHFDPNDGNWHIIDIFVNSDVNGMAYIAVDGNFLVSVSGGIDWTDSNGDPYQLGQIEIGILTQGGECSGDLYYDNIRLDEWTPPEPVPQPPTPFFAYYPTTPEANEEVTFYGHYTRDIDGDISSYSWNFGDGGTADGMNVTHSFTSEGLYTVALTVTDDTGLTASMTSKVLVETRTPVSAVGWALPLHTSGKTILDSIGNDVTLNFTGVGKMGLEYSGWPDRVYRESNPDYFESDTELMRSWGIKFIRLGFNWKYYMTNYEYREVVKQFVDTATSKGIVIIACVIRYDMFGYGFMPAFQSFPYEEIWRVGRDAVLSLKAFAHDFSYNPMVVGVEINEFRPYISDPPYEGYDYAFRFEIATELAQEVHTVNPDLLVGLEIHHDVHAAVSTEIKEYCRSLLQPNMVSMPHPYFTRDFGWRAIWGEYSTDPDQGKADMYDRLDNRFLVPQEYYNLPIVSTEWGSQGEQGPLVINDEFEYFMSHNWGSSYWAWFRQSAAESPYGMGLLLEDWVTPSASGEAFKQKLAEYNFD
jgi:PKD repeat protein